jgi:hypothetical protein
MRMKRAFKVSVKARKSHQKAVKSHQKAVTIYKNLQKRFKAA